MNLHFGNLSTNGYHSSSQVARVLTETWVADNMFCPRCGNLHINRFPNNRPVADFYCPKCKNEYELKSKNGRIAHKVNDGAYETMIQRITSNQNPDFFFMSYSKETCCVCDFVFVPKFFFVPDIIEKRKPLAESARRAGWTGCNILFEKIPKQGRIEIISGGAIQDISEVVNKVNKNSVLEINNIHARGWLLDILQCINHISTDTFTLSDVYAFETRLSLKHPQNQNIKAKIRQQLQFLRDKGMIEFLGNGVYRKL